GLNSPFKIQEFSDQELKAELSQREEKRCQSNKPQMFTNPNYEKLKALGQEYIDTLFNEGRQKKDADYYFLETAMTALFGPGVWDWINERIQ
ncbi:unnamed protein product, partial [marine sediment metagenome]